MAKSSSFFGMRKKSTKSLTFSTWRGMQITKDRVSDVANPQTSAQMAQRIKMPLVAQARTKLKGLVNHSFQGVDYGYKSLYNFSALNLRKNALTVGEYTPKGIGDMGVANYVVSTGSLEPVKIGLTESISLITGDRWTYKQDNETKLRPAPVFGAFGNMNYVQSIKNASGPTDKELFDFFLNVMLDNVETDQLSFLIQQQGVSYEWETKAGTQVGHYNNIWLYRIVQGAYDAGTQEIGFALQTGENWTEAGTKDIYLTFGEDLAIACKVDYKPATTGDNASEGSIKLSMFEPDDSNPASQKPYPTYGINNNLTGIYDEKPIGLSDSVNNGVTVTDASDNTTMNYAPFALCPVEDLDLPFAALTIINSRKVNEVWQRSPQRMVCLNYNPYFSESTVADTYLKTATSSAKFLNNGSESTGISGNSGMEVTTSSFDDSSDDEKSQG